MTEFPRSRLTSSINPQNLSINSQCFSNQLNNYSTGSTYQSAAANHQNATFPNSSKPLIQYLGSTDSQATEYRVSAPNIKKIGFPMFYRSIWFRYESYRTFPIAIKNNKPS